VLLTNGEVRLALEPDGKSEACVRFIEEFLAPQFARTSDGAAHFGLVLSPYEALPAELAARAIAPVAIRKSSARAFNLSGRAGALPDGRRIVVDDEHCTAFVFEPGDRVRAYWSERSRIQLYELTRYPSLLVEEASGHAVLHASAAADDPGCVLVVGDKGAGKTTTLFHLIQDHGLGLFSGDKALISSSGLVRGWPDYPHVGIGTLRRFPAIARACGVALVDEQGAARPPGEKVLIEPSRFRAATRQAGGTPLPVRAILFPHVTAPNRGWRELSPEERVAERLLPFVEYPHEFGAVSWHPLLRASRRQSRAAYHEALSALTRARWFELHGDVTLPAALVTN